MIRYDLLTDLPAELPRIVRDLATICGKQVRIEMEGKETDLDNRNKLVGVPVALLLRWPATLKSSWCCRDPGSPCCSRQAPRQMPRRR